MKDRQTVMINKDLHIVRKIKYNVLIKEKK